MDVPTARPAHHSVIPCRVAATRAKPAAFPAAEAPPNRPHTQAANPWEVLPQGPTPMTSPQAKPSPDHGFRTRSPAPVRSVPSAQQRIFASAQAHALGPSPTSGAAGAAPPSARRLRRLISAEDLLRDLPPLRDPVALGSSRPSAHSQGDLWQVPCPQPGYLPLRDPALGSSRHEGLPLDGDEGHQQLEQGQRQRQRRVTWPRCRGSPADELADVIIPSGSSPLDDSGPLESWGQEQEQEQEQEEELAQGSPMPQGEGEEKEEEVGDVDLRLLESKLELLSLRRHISAIKCQAFLSELESLQVSSNATSASTSSRRKSLDATSASLRRCASTRSLRRQSLDSLAAPPRPRRSRTRPRGQLASSSFLQRTSSSIPAGPAASLSYPNLGSPSLADPFGHACALYSPSGSGLATDQQISLSAFSTPTRKHRAVAPFSGTLGCFDEL